MPRLTATGHEHQLGSASFVAAALERLDAVPASITIDGKDRMAVDGMLNIVRRLAHAAHRSELV